MNKNISRVYTLGKFKIILNIQDFCKYKNFAIWHGNLRILIIDWGTGFTIGIMDKRVE